ncbi:MAG TPA: multicopper oxidase domain-containing protein [Gemmatimonadales bacterium]|nr:multicopper oxidase domain-containing protein [Gemmatimonadales bacterium]
MDLRKLFTVVVLAVPLHSGPVWEKLPTAAPNPNTLPAGSIRGGVLRIDLDTRLAMWHPDGDSLPGIAIEAFAERGRRPMVPGPLIRVPAGTEIRASVRNSLQRDTLTFYLPAGGALDSVVIAPGQRRELRVRATTPGTFLYRGVTSTPLHRKLRLGGLLAGALVVDTVSPAAPARDRVFVLLGAADTADPVLGFPIPERTVRSINGRSWPHGERLRVSVGDTVRWRVLNAGNDVHPMHLHGFYFRVDALEGPNVAAQGQGLPGRWVVTERMSAFSTMSVTWIPEREGNWLFHCHFQRHVVPHGPLNEIGPSGERQRIGSSSSARPVDHLANHAASAMAGLAVGVEVTPRASGSAEEWAPARRHLRLVATRDEGFAEPAPSMRYLAEEPHPTGRTRAPLSISPTLTLPRGEPVAITVVNRLDEPTAIHWHGIELESYYDGVAGFSGSVARVTPIIMPGDSFEARFTPPRAGTFIYHSHVDELRQHRAGLLGALIVRDSAAADSSRDLIFFIKSAREKSEPKDTVPLEINGTTDPDTTVLQVGTAYRMRFIGMQVRFPNATVTLTARADSSFANLRDTLQVRWRPVAKDGADIPHAARSARPAQQIISMGETYDFEFVPERSGNLRLEVRNAGPEGRLLVRAPIRVE